MLHDVLVVKDSYKDSVRLLEATRAMQSIETVDYGWSVMATPTNLDTLAGEGFEITGASANDLVIVVRAPDQETIDITIGTAKDVLFEVAATNGEDTVEAVSDLRAAIEQQPASNVAIVSVPGDYAALECHKALTAGLDVLLFSDNVSLEDEVELKTRAREMGRLVMGPGAGTAMLAGVGLGFANRVSKGPIGVVAAAGTGAQEVMSLLDRWGVGVTHVIGVGGRDLSADVGAIMARSGIEALEADDATEAILLVSKPPSPEVAAALLGQPRTKPMVAAVIGLKEPLDNVAEGIDVCNTLEMGAVLTAGRLERPVPDRVGGAATAVADVIVALPQTRRRLVGLFSGGTLCYEAMTIATEHIGPIYSNTPLNEAWALPHPDDAHVCLDLGEEEYTVGRPHPMIDPEARIDWMEKQLTDSSVAVVLIDVVIGDGAHPDPASLLAPVASKIIDSGAVVVAYVLGTENDPQGFKRQQEQLKAVGCVVTETAARAALAAAAIVNRDPGLVHHDLDS